MKEQGQAPGPGVSEPYDVSLGVGDGSGNMFVYGTYEAIKVCQDKLIRNANLERQLAEAQDAMEKALVVELGLRAELKEARACDSDELMVSELNEMRTQLADERARIDCATRGGWLSEDLECAGEDGPACWKHLLAEAQGEVAALVMVLDEIRWPLVAEPACAGHRVRAKTDSERIQMADDALEGHLPRLKLSPATLASAKEMREAQGKLSRIETELCMCATDRPFSCLIHDTNSPFARILKGD